VNILSMLVRLQSTLGCSDLVNQMVLLPQVRPMGSSFTSGAPEINLVVGFSSSARSLTALDLTLWIAHQTRLATGKQVTVQVVYVVERPIAPKIPVFSDLLPGLLEVDVHAPDQDDSTWSRLRHRQASVSVEPERGTCATIVAAPDVMPPASVDQFDPAEQFEQADRILWQARCLADEWRGSLKTHLRFGTTATELRSVVQAEAAALLILGCESADHPLVQALGPNFPCPVLGIPSTLPEN
jgi:hypothetical protein